MAENLPLPCAHIFHAECIRRLREAAKRQGPPMAHSAAMNRINLLHLTARACERLCNASVMGQWRLYEEELS